MPGDRRNRREQLERYLAGLQKGEADLVLQADLDLTNAAFAHLKETALANEIERVKGTTTEQTYVEYCLAQRGCIEDLNDILEQYREAKNASAIVGAVKARSDIIDKMIKLGQDFGIIEKKPEEKRLVAGVVVTQLSNDDLKAAIAEQISSLNGLVTRFGDHKLTDIEPGQLYRDAPDNNVIEAKLEDPAPPPPEAEPTPEVEAAPEVEPPPPEPPPPPPPAHEAISERARRLMAPSPPVRPAEPDKKNRAKRGKVYRGRRVVKPPGR